jgi:hypothetical protein
LALLSSSVAYLYSTPAMRKPREAGFARRASDLEVVVMELVVVEDAVELVAHNDASVDMFNFLEV